MALNVNISFNKTQECHVQLVTLTLSSLFWRGKKKEKKLLSARGLKTENTWRERLENEFVGLPLSTMEIKINIALTKKH